MQLPLPRVTAAEIVVLRRIHGDDAVVKIKYIGDRQVSDAEEFARLANKYQMATEGNQPVVGLCYPGSAPILPREITKPAKTYAERRAAEVTVLRPDEIAENDKMLANPIPLDEQEDDEGDELPTADPEETDVLLEDPQEEDPEETENLK